MTMQARLWLTAAAVALAAPAQAANLGLMIDAGEAEAGEAGGFGIVGDALNARGYEVYERTGAGRDAMREALEELSGRLDEAERLVLVFAGRIWAEEGRVWLLPADFEGEGRVDVAFDGVPLDLLLAAAAERPGRSAVVVAYDEAVTADEEAADEAADGEAADGEADPGAAAAAAAAGAQAWARADVPQGVLVLVGPRAAALEAVGERLLTEGLSAAEAVEGLEDVEGPERVRVYGFVSPDASFGDPAAEPEQAAAAPEPEPAPPPAPAPEPAPEPTPEPTPEEAAEAAEAELGLSLEARRGLQENLLVLGYDTRGIDGIIGPGSRAAIARWQEDEGLDASGFLDAEQLARLRSQADARTVELRAEAERARAAEEVADAAFWRTTGAAGGAADLRTYLGRYPDGLYAAEARAQLASLEAEARAEAGAADLEDWLAAEAEGTVEALRGYLEARPDGAFAAEAEARIAEIDDAPRLAAIEEEAAAGEAALGLNAASRALIESQLDAVGYPVGATDGSFDAETRSGVRAFQTSRGLPATGYVDQATVQALLAASLGLR